MKEKTIITTSKPSVVIGKSAIFALIDGTSIKTSRVVDTWEEESGHVMVETLHTLYRVQVKPVVRICGAMISGKGEPAQVQIGGTWYTTGPVVDYYKAPGGFVETEHHLYQM